ncbi:MAG: hypothetical protein WCE63_18845 [Acidobacteriaceae bacterium]
MTKAKQTIFKNKNKNKEARRRLQRSKSFLVRLLNVYLVSPGRGPKSKKFFFLRKVCKVGIEVALVDDERAIDGI